MLLSQTCFFNSVSWTLNEGLMEHMELHYSAYFKAGIGAGFALNDLEKVCFKIKLAKIIGRRMFFNKSF